MPAKEHTGATHEEVGHKENVEEDQVESSYTLAMVLLQRGYRAAEVAELTGLSTEEVLALCGS